MGIDVSHFSVHQAGQMIVGGAAVTAGGIVQMSGIATQLSSLAVGCFGGWMLATASTLKKDGFTCPNVSKSPTVNELNCVAIPLAMGIIGLFGITLMAAPIIYEAGKSISEQGAHLRNWGFKQMFKEAQAM